MTHRAAKTIPLIGLLFLVCVFAADVAYNLYSLYTTPLLKPGSTSIVFEVKPNTSANKFVQNLYTADFIHSQYVLRTIIRVQGLSNRIKAGLYLITKQDTAKSLLTRVLAGEVLVESFRIVEGT